MSTTPSPRLILSWSNVPKLTMRHVGVYFTILFVLNLSFFLISEALPPTVTPERQSSDPDLTVKVELGCLSRTGAPELFHSGRQHQRCLLNEDPRCQVWASQLEGIHWPRLCLITSFCAWNTRHPVLIWHSGGSIGWHLKSAIVVPAGKRVEHGTVGAISMVWLYCRFMSLNDPTGPPHPNCSSR